MKQRGKMIITMSIISLILSCKNTQRVIHIDQEYISLRLIDSVRYKYLHYNLTGTHFAYEYNTGRYLHNGKHYNLFPDSIDNEHYNVEYQQKRNKVLGDKLKVSIRTDIKGDYLNQYTTQIFADSDSNMVFHNVSVDTILNNKVQNIKVKIVLPSKFSKGMGTQLPAFQSITTGTILIDSTINKLDIYVPARFSTFFYKYEKEIHLEDAGLNWKVNGRYVPMRNVSF